jgi:hypothetical protein
VERIILESYAKTYGGGAGEAVTDRLCTKAKAISFGCDVASEYEDGQLVPASALSPSAPTVTDIEVTKLYSQPYVYSYDTEGTYQFYVKAVMSDGTKKNIVGDSVITMKFGSDIFIVGQPAEGDEILTVRKGSSGWVNYPPGNHTAVLEVDYESLHKEAAVADFSKGTVTLELESSGWLLSGDRVRYSGTLKANSYGIEYVQLYPFTTPGGDPNLAVAYVTNGSQNTWNALVEDNTHYLPMFALGTPSENNMIFDYQGNFGDVDHVSWNASNLRIVEVSPSESMEYRNYTFTLSDS